MQFTIILFCCCFGLKKKKNSSLGPRHKLGRNPGLRACTWGSARIREFANPVEPSAIARALCSAVRRKTHKNAKPRRIFLGVRRSDAVVMDFSEEARNLCVRRTRVGARRGAPASHAPSPSHQNAPTASAGGRQPAAASAPECAPSDVGAPPRQEPEKPHPGSPGPAPPPPAGNPHPGLTPNTLHRAPVCQGPLGPKTAKTIHPLDR